MTDEISVLHVTLGLAEAHHNYAEFYITQTVNPERGTRI